MNEHTPTTTQTMDDVELPAPGTWRLDPGHADVGFVGRHFMLTKIRGRFVDVDALLEIAEKPEDSHLEATIQMASVDSGDATRDQHLRSADLFDVERHPVAAFESTRISWNGQSGSMTGDLTIKDITRSVTLDVTLLGVVTDPWDNQRAVFDARGRINREDWDITWNMLLGSGRLLVSNEIDLVFHVELIRQ